MRILVTGAAGFIGSRLVEFLLANDQRVTGVDCFSDYYHRALKRANISFSNNHPHFNLLEANLCQVNLAPLLAQADAVVHLAAQAGVRASWGSNFGEYINHNIDATQKILEALKVFPHIHLIFASSSSVYGQPDEFPTREISPCRPLSPYGVSKLAAENLCWLYYKNFGVKTTSLRFFTVYGPRQRPDMAIHRFIRAMLEDQEIILWGDGAQSRDFTYVDDIVAAIWSCLHQPQAVGQVFNLGGGARTSVNEILAVLEAKIAKKARIARHASARGDVRDTCADTALAKEILGFYPQINLDRGLERQIQWTKQNLPHLQAAGPCFA
jgi:UDP-glucose 4-epimerase